MKNGRRKNRSQVYFCKNCKKWHQDHDVYTGSKPTIKGLIKRMLVRASGIRGIAYTLKVSAGFVLRTLLYSHNAQLYPKLEHYEQVQVDEH